MSARLNTGRKTSCEVSFRVANAVLQQCPNEGGYSTTNKEKHGYTAEKMGMGGVEGGGAVRYLELFMPVQWLTVCINCVQHCATLTVHLVRYM